MTAVDRPAEPRLRVDLSSTVPQYEQIRAQLAVLISAGVLRDGERLPTAKVLGGDLGIAPGTVTRAYRLLEESGYVHARRRVGTIVRTPSVDGDLQSVIEAARELVRRGAARGMGQSELQDIVAAAVLEAGTDGRSGPGRDAEAVSHARIERGGARPAWIQRPSLA
ncbi:GntR family transcriptional regulator [Oerskovia sp. KBS0722]|uniref:GntR family transcriptional regulator n=1 Tax=Oerskovia sp. KBS0722 TaxID=1179673 RepID=UPI001FED9A36|nr:GntR family transcriptional regulator [Oerskovia sp. KBS0722]